MDTNRQRVEYIWLDGNYPLPQLRSKTRFIEKETPILNWNFDGGSTKQGTLIDSDRCLKMVRTYKDPFIKDGLLAFCEVSYHDGSPHESNSRFHLRNLSDSDPVEDGYLVGFEQEFTFINPASMEPLGLLLSPKEQGQYYCGVGCMNQIGRYVLDDFECACAKAGLKLDGVNAEVMPGQWEFQTHAQGPLQAADDLWVARYLLDRVCEDKPLIVSYDPKPADEFNGAGCHTNISTSSMRKSFKADTWTPIMEQLKKDHEKYIEICGEGLERRMTGACETSDFKKFTWGVGDRGASVRIPQLVVNSGFGYFEDRRPCANIDPYKVLYSLISSIKKASLL